MQVGVRHMVKEAFDVGRHHPVRPFVDDHCRHSPSRDAGCCLPEGQTRRHSPSEFSKLYAFKAGITRYPCTSPAFVPTHQSARTAKLDTGFVASLCPGGIHSH